MTIAEQSEIELLLNRLLRQEEGRSLNSVTLRENRKVQPDLPITKLLRVQNDHFTAGAVFEKKGDRWVCIEAAPIIKWMLVIPFEEIKANLLKRGCRWEWD